MAYTEGMVNILTVGPPAVTDALTSVRELSQL